MTPNNFETFKKSYNNAVEGICAYLNTPADVYDADMAVFTKWLMETDANPYGFLPDAWANIGTAETFLDLLNNVHHAVYDDGDITFVTVDGEPRIVFASQWEDGFRQKVLSKAEHQIEEQRNMMGILKPYTTEVLDIRLSDFGRLYDEWHVNHTKKCFLAIASRKGAEEAASYYRGKKCWDESWMKEVKGV